MLDHFPILAVTDAERGWLRTGLQSEIPGILSRLENPRYDGNSRAALKFGDELVGVAVKNQDNWDLERIIPLE
jgi:hypothetical protein